MRTAAENRFFQNHATIRWHEPGACGGEWCAIHNPSNHQLREWPIQLKALGFMERTCPHGIGHPDPDSLAFFQATHGPEAGFDIHGCDGCCTKPARPAPSTLHEILQ